MKNLVSATARVSRDGGGENLLDDVRLFGGEEIQWRIFLSLYLLCEILHSLVNFRM